MKNIHSSIKSLVYDLQIFIMVEASLFTEIHLYYNKKKI